MHYPQHKKSRNRKCSGKTFLDGRSRSGEGFVLDGLVHVLVSGDLALESVHDKGREDADDAEDDEHPADRRLEQTADVAVADAKSAAQAFFADGPYNIGLMSP